MLMNVKDRRSYQFKFLERRNRDDKAEDDRRDQEGHREV